jgi:hypothetical protein
VTGITAQDYIFSAAILCLALALLWGLVVARRADRDKPDLESDRDRDRDREPGDGGDGGAYFVIISEGDRDRDRDREPGDGDEPDLNAESGRERQLRDYRDKYR